jgi:hypothetical protein
LRFGLRLRLRLASRVAAPFCGVEDIGRRRERLLALPGIAKYINFVRCALSSMVCCKTLLHCQKYRKRGDCNLPVVELFSCRTKPAACSKIHGMAGYVGSCHVAWTELLGQRFDLENLGCTDTDCHVVGRGSFAIA